jgi:hypothetical protein
MLIMQMVKTAFLGRIDRSQRHQAAIIIDEFAAMSSGEVAEVVDTILREARKFGASQILATQSINQLDAETKKNVQVNTNQKIVLLMSDPDEAREAAKILGSDQIKDVDVRNIPKYHGYIKAMANKSPQPPCLLRLLPPRNLAPSDWSPATPALTKPDVSDVWNHVHQLSRGVRDPNDLETASDVINFLRDLDEPTWNQVVHDSMSWNRYQASRLMAQPELIPDKVERTLTISRALYGLPWWLREAHYWRTLQAGKRRPGRPRKNETASEHTQTEKTPNWE